MIKNKADNGAVLIITVFIVIFCIAIIATLLYVTTTYTKTSFSVSRFIGTSEAARSTADYVMMNIDFGTLKCGPSCTYSACTDNATICIDDITSVLDYTIEAKIVKVINTATGKLFIIRVNAQKQEQKSVIEFGYTVE